VIWTSGQYSNLVPRTGNFLVSKEIVALRWWESETKI